MRQLYCHITIENNARETEHIDSAGTGPLEGLGQRRNGGTRGQHIVDKDDPPAIALAEPGEIDTKGARNIAGALACIEPDLLARALVSVD